MGQPRLRPEDSVQTELRRLESQRNEMQKQIAAFVRKGARSLVALNCPLKQRPPIGRFEFPPENNGSRLVESSNSAL